jgi:hypothetical protein
VAAKLEESVLYRIYTEDTPRYRQAVIRNLKRNGFPHFTLFSTDGYGPGQRGLQENTAVIEVLVEEYRGLDTDREIEALAGQIRRKNKQQTVLLMRIPAFHKFKVARQRGKRRKSVTQDRVDVISHHLWAEGRGPARNRAAYRGKVLAGFGEWEKLLANDARVEGRIVRFF